MPTIEIRGKQLHYLDEGQGPVVLFGHSYLWDQRMWSYQVEALRPRFRCIVPDLWGHGKSAELPATPCDLASLAEDHGQLLDALGIREFMMIGLSVGGMWGALLAQQRAKTVRGLVLMDTFLGPEPDANRQRYFGMLDTVERVGAIPSPMVDAVLPLFLGPRTLADNLALVADFRRDLAALTPGQMPSIVALGRAIFGRPDHLEILPSLAIPTLVVVGEHDLSRPVPEAERMVARVPRGELAIIKDAGHVSAKEQPTQVNEILGKFLDRVSTGPRFV
jgi:pimeloyl-ACP methyl ester carboxylesterase